LWIFFRWRWFQRSRRNKIREKDDLITPRRRRKKTTEIIKEKKREMPIGMRRGAEMEQGGGKGMCLVG
jgi:hypothetical protein